MIRLISPRVDFDVFSITRFPRREKGGSKTDRRNPSLAAHVMQNSKSTTTATMLTQVILYSVNLGTCHLQTGTFFNPFLLRSVLEKQTRIRVENFYERKTLKILMQETP